jgi:hypothetical protein
MDVDVDARAETNSVSSPNPFFIDSANRSYKHQYSNIYFTRLHHQRAAVLNAAERKWQDWEGWCASFFLARARSSNGRLGPPVLVERLLDVEKGLISYIVGTVYMDMPLKPNVMEDVGRDVWVTPYRTTVRAKLHIPSARSLLPRRRTSSTLTKTVYYSKTSLVVFG